MTVPGRLPTLVTTNWLPAIAAYPPLDRQQEIKALQVDIKTSINLEGFIPKN
jgi:hypothetical protein